MALDYPANATRNRYSGPHLTSPVKIRKSTTDASKGATWSGWITWRYQSGTHTT
ncbi:hypothetical protein CCACVL1_09698 [Corchorus capsularis]|uniref:Uncharacterized protein n=1 Tax=Corchorus capsularis TaxID=210143 RepID=A0A1R3IUG9_COCAP|nr:hypothetical protein CCACVL1_09698 [Corchorus capsularis]